MDSVERMMEAMEDVGSSVIMTTLTTSAAFALGYVSTIPAIKWLCLYAFPCVLIDFLYQITFFTALIVIDDRRVKANKLDCVVCCRSSRSEPKEDIQQSEIPERSKTFTEKLMGRYCDILMKPWVKVFVLVSFTAMLGGFTYATSQLEQFFDYRDLLPTGSYVSSYFDTLKEHSEDLTFQPEVIFRDVDVSDPEVQAAMNKYLSDLTTLDSITELPTFFWLQDFTEFESVNEAAFVGMTFEEKLTEFLADPVFCGLYAYDITRDPDGVVTASRTKVIMDNVDGLDVKDQVKSIEDQRAMTKSQPINEDLGKGKWHFFTILDMYFIWDFYAVAGKVHFITYLMNTLVAGPSPCLSFSQTTILPTPINLKCIKWRS
jgi:Niemann-Pick C1 protein